jgi:hypothetical protein
MSLAFLTLEHDAVALCAAYRFTTRAKALAFLNDFDVERRRWLAVAEMAAARAEAREFMRDVAALETCTRKEQLSIFTRVAAAIFRKA